MIKDRFVNQLKTLITTMSEVKEPKSFDMNDWYIDSDVPGSFDGDEVHLECGYAACICGHQSLASEESEHFVLTADSPHRYRAAQVSKSLNSACFALTGDTILALAVTGGDYCWRIEHADNSGLFTDEEMQHPHLRKEKPSIQDAISFMELMLTKLGEHE
jgi:hypothetical protein